MAVNAVVSGVAKKLGDLLIDEATLLYGVKDEVQWIQTELRQMQCFLQDAEDKQETNLNVKNWVNDIRDVAFDAEDVLETYIIDNKLQKTQNFIMRCSYFLINLSTQHQIGRKIKLIKTKIRQISDRRSTYGIEAIGGGGVSGGEGSSSASERLRGFRQIYPHHEDEIKVVGLEKYVNVLKAQLIGESLSPRRGRCVISIVGMGGSGKTTLAKTVYNCEEVTRHFQCRAWVSVSQVYDIMEILQSIAKECLGLERKESQTMKEVELEVKIYEFLKAQRHLVVLDDVWEVNVWNRLKSVFSATNNESRIIFTTRNRDVALHADKKSLLELQPLSNEESWELFVKKVLSVEKVHTFPKELEEVGKSIVKKCSGLPLAIVLLGGLGKSSVHHWSKVLAGVNSQLNQEETPCTPILALSYNDLPFHLKSCFLYLGIFPEDYEISARMLIQMWISEGFVHQRGDQIAEDVAEDYLEELVDRSMVQVVARRFNGSIKKCCIHDILRDLAISKAKEVQLFHIHPHANSSSTTCSPPLNKVRRLALHSTINDLSMEHSQQYIRSDLSMEHSQQYIRSAFCFGTSDEAALNGVLHSIVSFQMLRVLHISSVHILPGTTLRKAIGKLINLRYLRIEFFCVNVLSSIISNLENLETLYLRWIGTTRGDHYVISKLNHLRHLKLTPTDQIRLDPPSGNDSCSISIKNLQTLWALYIDRQSLVKDGWDKYTNLRKLYLTGYLESHVEALVDWIAKLDRLESLRLDFKNPIQRLNMFSRNNNFRNLYKLWLEGVWIEELPNPSEFPSNLFQLSLFSCRLGKETFPTLQKLSNLKFLRIAIATLHVNDINFLSGGFPQLQQLHFGGLNDLEEWKVEKGALPCLRELSICDCKRLKALPDGLRHVTTLQKLYLEMDLEFLARVKPNVGEDWGNVAHVPTIQTFNWPKMF